MDVTLQYFDGCPNWQTINGHLAALIRGGLDFAVDHVLVDGYSSAVEKQFRGSPTVLIDGVDPFGDAKAPVGLFCRTYDTEHGPAGSPSLDQVRTAIRSAQKGN